MSAYLTFKLNREYLAIPANCVLEVIRKQHITQIPHAPACILGVVNYRGKVLTVINTYEKFNLSMSSDDNEYVLIVFEIAQNDQKYQLAIIADRVENVIEIAPAEVQLAPEFRFSYSKEYITGIVKYKEHFMLLPDVKFFSIT